MRYVAWDSRDIVRTYRITEGEGTSPLERCATASFDSENNCRAHRIRVLYCGNKAANRECRASAARTSAPKATVSPYRCRTGALHAGRCDSHRKTREPNAAAENGRPQRIHREAAPVVGEAHPTHLARRRGSTPLGYAMLVGRQRGACALFTQCMHAAKWSRGQQNNGKVRK